MYIVELEAQIDDIPCLVGVKHYERFVSGYTSGRPEDCYPDEGGRVDFEILNLRGRRSAYLEQAATDRDWSKLESLVRSYFEDE